MYGDAMMDTNMAAENQQKHLHVTEFFYKSVNLSLEDFKNVKIILFLIRFFHELFR